MIVAVLPAVARSTRTASWILLKRFPVSQWRAGCRSTWTLASAVSCCPGAYRWCVLWWRQSHVDACFGGSCCPGAYRWCVLWWRKSQMHGQIRYLQRSGHPYPAKLAVILTFTFPSGAVLGWGSFIRAVPLVRAKVKITDKTPYVMSLRQQHTAF